MTRAEIAGLRHQDAALEAEIRGRLNEVEAALEKAVRSDSDFVTEAAAYLVAAGGKRFRPMLVLLGGLLRRPHRPAPDPGRGGDRDHSPGDALPRRRHRRGGVPPRAARR